MAILTQATLKAEEAHPPLFPFVISYDAPDNVANMSHLLDAPAGKHGFVRVENGRFATDAGPIRFNATNLTGPANFPTHEQADKLADRLARFGINCVRFHFFDVVHYTNFAYPIPTGGRGILAVDSTTQRNFDPEQVDKLDYLIAALKKRGIYSNINLHVARKWDNRDGFSEANHRPHFDKGLDNFEPRMIELQKEYARKLLTHVNPYTGLTYANDPTVAMVEINNENALMDYYHRGAIGRLPEPYSTQLRELWNAWLSKRYGTREAMQATWAGETLKEADKQSGGNRKFDEPLVFTGKRMEIVSLPSPLAMRDFYQFIVDTERPYWRGMYDYLKNDLGVKAPVSSTQMSYTSPHVLAEMDYLDDHTYWGHPDPVSPKWRQKNTASVNAQGWGPIHRLAGRRMHGKPFTISEYNHPFPIQYGAEAQMMLSAYGALQGWDGVFSYTYNHTADFEPDRVTFFFSVIARTDVLAHFPACAAVFLRGDVQEAGSEVVAFADWSTYFERLVNTRNIWIGIGQLGFDGRQVLIRKTSVDVSGNATRTDPSSIEKIGPGHQPLTIVSETGELAWNAENKGSNWWTANTPNTKLFTGFVRGQTVSFDDITLEIGKTRLGWATVSMVSKHGHGFGKEGKSDNILLTATGFIQNTDMVIRETGKDEITLDDWGRGPVLAEGIPAVITLPTSPDRTRCFALDERGERKAEIPVETVKGKSRITIGPEYQTVWYEIQID